MPWVLTWLTHEMGNPKLIGRAFDFFICSHPITPLFCAASVFLQTISKK